MAATRRGFFGWLGALFAGGAAAKAVGIDVTIKPSTPTAVSMTLCGGTARILAQPGRPQPLAIGQMVACDAGGHAVPYTGGDEPFIGFVTKAYPDGTVDVMFRGTML